MTLVATVSGGAIFLSLAGFSQVRVWNRMSLLIGFCALAYALTWLEAGWRAVRERVASTPARDRAWPRQLVGVALTAALVGFVLWDGAHVVVDHEAADAAWEADRDLVAAIDDAVPDGTAVFQLPVTPFPEAGPVYDMHDYDHLRAFIHTEDAHLLWSYGAMRGRPDGDWQLEVRDRLGEVGALPALLGAGFDGLWVDTFGYADRGAAGARRPRRGHRGRAPGQRGRTDAVLRPAAAAGGAERSRHVGRRPAPDRPRRAQPRPARVAARSSPQGRGPRDSAISQGRHGCSVTSRKPRRRTRTTRFGVKACT